MDNAKRRASILNMKQMLRGEALTVAEMVNRMKCDPDSVQNTVRSMVTSGYLERGLRNNKVAEYWLPRDRSRWLKRRWLRPTGMRITRQYREERGVYVQ